MSSRAWGALACVIAASPCLDASARSFRVNDIPNGTVNGCLNCHTDMSGTSFTPFGSDVRSHLVGTGTVDTRHVDWSAALCNRDSDGDTYSNGVELGDPNCTWTAGSPDPSGAVFNPGDPGSFPSPVCGNGKLDFGEQCDGMLLSMTNCTDLGMGTGTLSCTSDCMFDTTACSTHHLGSTGAGGGSGSGNSGGGCAMSSTSASTTDPWAVAGVTALALACAVTSRRRARKVSSR